MKRLLLTLALLAAALPAMAQPAQAPPPPPPDEATRAAARQLGERLGFAQQAQAILAGFRAQTAIAFARANNKQPDETAKVVDEVIMPDFAAASPELVALIVDAWATTFTAAELRELQAFYATPVGAKFAASGGQMAQLINVSSRLWAQGVLQKSLRAHEPELRSRGLKN